MLTWLLSSAFAQYAVPIGPTLELTGVTRLSIDLEVFVRYDGNIYVDDQLVFASDLLELLIDRIEAEPGVRVVITGDNAAPYDAFVTVVNAARLSGADRVALEIAGLVAPKPVDPLFPGSGEVVNLDAVATDVKDVAPKRHRYPQDPYSNTSSFTAYTLEWGETKLGVASWNTSIAPRLQIGTAPALDAVGLLNVSVKANFFRTRRIDGALLAQYYTLPLTTLADFFGLGSLLEGPEAETVTANADYIGLGTTTSIQILDPWSIHVQGYWARPALRGNIAFDDLPVFILPGLSGELTNVGVGAIGDILIATVATDVRFNRRDSVYLWVRYPFHGRVRGQTSGEVAGLEGLENTDVILAYGDWIKFEDSYSVAIGYQASFKHIEGRVGIGLSSVPYAWALQAFDLSYRFGGATKRKERRIRKGFEAQPIEIAPPDLSQPIDMGGLEDGLPPADQLPFDVRPVDELPSVDQLPPFQPEPPPDDPAELPEFVPPAFLPPAEALPPPPAPTTPAPRSVPTPVPTVVPAPIPSPPPPPPPAPPDPEPVDTGLPPADTGGPGAVDTGF